MENDFVFIKEVYIKGCKISFKYSKKDKRYLFNKDISKKNQDDIVGLFEEIKANIINTFKNDFLTGDVDKIDDLLKKNNFDKNYPDCAEVLRRAGGGSLESAFKEFLKTDDCAATIHTAVLERLLEQADAEQNKKKEKKKKKKERQKNNKKKAKAVEFYNKHLIKTYFKKLKDVYNLEKNNKEEAKADEFYNKHLIKTSLKKLKDVYKLEKNKRVAIEFYNKHLIKTYFKKLKDVCKLEKNKRDATELSGIYDNYPRDVQKIFLKNVLKHNLTCIISLELMTDPVMTANGNTYENKDITKWLKKCDTDPLDNTILPNKELIPNRLVKSIVSSLN